MRSLVLTAAVLAGSLAPSLAHAADVEVGADVDVAFAYGSTLKGPGGGAALRLGVGPNPLALGPTALSIMAEVQGAYWVFPDATDGDTSLVRMTGGARGILTLLWIRKPKDQGGRGRGIRLDMPIAIHGGVGSLDEGTTWTPTGDASVGIAVGLLPVQLGVHVKGGALAASQQVEDIDGTAWLGAGVDLGLVF